MSSKDVEAFVRRLRHAGLADERSGGGHYKVMTPEGGTIAFLPFSPSTNRWRENTIAQLRKRGIVLEDDPRHPGGHGHGRPGARPPRGAAR